MIKIAAGAAAIASGLAFLAGTPVKGALFAATAIVLAMWVARQKTSQSKPE